MFAQFKIRWRVGLGFVLVVFLTVAAIVPVVLAKFDQLSRDAEQRQLTGLYGNLIDIVIAEGRMAEAMAATVANNPGIQSLFAAGDREGLLAQTAPIFETAKGGFDMRQFQFHLPPATSFLRVHKPEKFGDDLSAFRQTVVAANTSQSPIMGVEKGVAGFGIRGVVPVFHEGRHIGSVEFGASLGQPFVDEFKDTHEGTNLGVHVPDGNGFKTLASTLQDSILTPEEMRRVMAGGGPVIHTAELDGVPVAVYGGPLFDYAGDPVGVLEIIVDRSVAAATVAAARNATLGIGALGVLVAILIGLFITRSIVRPLCLASNKMHDIADGEGDLTQRLAVTGNDELAQLASGFNKFVDKIQALVRQVAGATAQLAAAAEELSAT